MSLNCSISGNTNCTILNGATTNGTFWVSPYDPDYPVPYWHQNMQLATICVANSLTCKSSNSVRNLQPCPLMWLLLCATSLALIVLIVNNTCIVIVIVARIWYRWSSVRRWRPSDQWITAAGVCPKYPNSKFGSPI
jgi:hypothetical protein